MLTSLHIENIAVAKEIDFELSDGFTVFTGETGAGKSIIIDAISLLIGGKFTPDLLRTGETKAMVSGYFSGISEQNAEYISSLGVDADDEGGLFIQRDFSSDGKVRTRINGRSVPLSLLRSVTGAIINIHGQHDNQKLLDQQNHLKLLDLYACNEDLLREYTEKYRSVTDVRSRIRELMISDSEKERESEMLKFQIEEISALKVAPGEEPELEKKAALLKDIKKNRTHTDLVYRALFKNKKGMSADALIEIAQSSLGSLADVMPLSEEYISRLDSIRSELEEIAVNTLSVTEGISDDPEKELNEIESKLSTLKKLKKKYGYTVEEILDFSAKSKERLDNLLTSDLQIKELTKQMNALTASASAVADKLYESRKSAAEKLERLICSQLEFMDMHSAQFIVRIVHTPGDLSETGCDRVEFLLSANKGEDPKPLSQIASGGELARIMLGIKSVFAEKEETETLIYDEIDTGISGRTSQKLGLVLKNCSKTAQVLSVTHSAQIASVGDHHILVSKNVSDGRTSSSVREISGDERIEEIARIMGGNKITDELRKSASVLINETR